jgi:hypothetical protein
MWQLFMLFAGVASLRLGIPSCCLQTDSIAEIIGQLGTAELPGNTTASKPIRNGGGGVFNHHMYFKACLASCIMACECLYLATLNTFHSRLRYASLPKDQSN